MMNRLDGRLERLGRWRASVIAQWTCLLLLPVATPVPAAAEIVDLYSVTVQLDPEDSGARDDAYADALRQALIRVTGSAEEEDLAGLAEVFGKPDRYVLRYRPGSDNTLEVSVDGQAIEQILRRSRRTIWGADRPITLVWLAVDWGQGVREIVGAANDVAPEQTSRSIDRNRLLRERIEATARHRGISVVFPLLDTEDLRKISFSDIWGGFDERLIDASRRYGATSILVGRVRPRSAQANRWTYFFGANRISISGQPEDVTNQVADQLAEMFAVQGDAILDTYAVTVDGIDSVVAYGRLQQLMEGISVVENYAITTVAGNRIEYEVSTYGGIDRLAKALELSGMLRTATVVADDDFQDRGMPGPGKLFFEFLP